MHRITRKLEIDAGHRLLNHEGKCRNYHGHRYVFEITIESAGLDEVGRVIDFSVVKEKVGGWLDAFFDHGMILQRGDPMIPMLVNMAFENGTIPKHIDPDLVTQLDSPKLYVLEKPPTAENLVEFVAKTANELIETQRMRVVAVRCYETPNCWADWRDE